MMPRLSRAGAWRRSRAMAVGVNRINKVRHESPTISSSLDYIPSR